ncbi:S26 family signal peptidase [Streptomyces sp. NPDC014991]|uniref:S26 family signal peptidase n=1 Tax=Streptomyces sp. NPDC014991 TaxID=3364935 RepID=UPI0037023C5F
MQPTYQRGDRIVRERAGGGEVRRGDVVMFSSPERYGNAGPLMEERVVGVGGDHVACCAAVAGKERVAVTGGR